MNQPLPLTASATTEWRQRVPRVVLSRLAAIGVLVLFAVAAVLGFMAPGADVTTAADVESPSWVLAAPLMAGVLASVVVLWLRPHAGIWWAAGFVVAAVAIDPLDVQPTLWWTAAAVLGMLAVADAGSRARQRAIAHAWSRRSDAPPAAVPTLEDETRHYATAWNLLALAGGTLGLVLSVGCGLWAWHDVGATAQFRSTAIVSTGTVLAFDDDAFVARVEVDGAARDVPTTNAEPEAGDDVEVRYDPTGTRAELTDDVFDPSGALFPTSAAFVLGSTLLVVELRRRRHVTRMLAHGGVPVACVATWVPGAAVAELRTLDGAILGTVPDLLGDPDHEADETRYPPVHLVDDTELLRLAASIDEPEKAPAPRPGDPDTWAGTRVTVVGLLGDGRPVAVQGPDGAWYVSERGPRDPLVLRHRRTGKHAAAPAFAPPSAADAAPRTSGAHGAPVAGHPESVPEPAVHGTFALLGRRLVRATARTGPLLAAPVVAVALWYLDPGWHRFLMAVWLPGVAHAWAARDVPRLTIARDGLHVAGALRDEVVPWGAVDRVVASDGALVVRTTADPAAPLGAGDEPETDPEHADDALMFAWSPADAPLVVGAPDPHAAAAAIRAALSTRGATAPEVHRARFSRPAVVAGLWALAVLAGPWLVGLLWGAPPA